MHPQKSSMWSCAQPCPKEGWYTCKGRLHLFENYTLCGVMKGLERVPRVNAGGMLPIGA